MPIKGRYGCSIVFTDQLKKSQVLQLYIRVYFQLCVTGSRVWYRFWTWHCRSLLCTYEHHFWLTKCKYIPIEQNIKWYKLTASTCIYIHNICNKCRSERRRVLIQIKILANNIEDARYCFINTEQTKYR